MKSNVLKTSLSAFVFTLAIVASFAFSAAQSDLETDPADKVYLQNPDSDTCVDKTNVLQIDCYVSNSGPACTIQVGPVSKPLFADSDPSISVIKCDLRLSTVDPNP